MVVAVWPVSLVTGPGVHGEPLFTPLGLEGYHFFFSWGPQVRSLLRVNRTHSESDASSPFAQNDCEVVSQTRSSTSRRVQVGMGPHWEVNPKK